MSNKGLPDMYPIWWGEGNKKAIWYRKSDIIQMDGIFTISDLNLIKGCVAKWKEDIKFHKWSEEERIMKDEKKSGK